MKYAMLKQQPLLRVQVAASSFFFFLKKTTLFFLKKEIQALTFWKKKPNKWIKGAKNAISKLKDRCVRKRNT